MRTDELVVMILVITVSLGVSVSLCYFIGTTLAGLTPWITISSGVLVGLVAPFTSS